jgi:hypothetical protein
MTKPTWTKEQFINAIKNSKSISQVFKKLGLSSGTSNYTTFHKYKEKWNLDTSHFNKNQVIRESVLKTKSKTKTPLKDILTKKSYYNRVHLKNRLIKEGLLKYECYTCGIIDWCEKKLSLQIDHINGNSIDNRLKNLQLLCPNCHSQTDSFAGKKTKDKQKYICQNCNCDKKCNKGKLCVKCANVQNKDRSIIWPALDELKALVDELGILKTSEKLDVSDTSVRKRLKSKKADK